MPTLLGIFVCICFASTNYFLFIVGRKLRYFAEVLWKCHNVLHTVENLSQ